ncbi:TraR/DksA C4-type zinc finger protein [Sphingomonas sp. UYP23]
MPEWRQAKGRPTAICGDEIPEARRIALPSARTCVPCQPNRDSKPAFSSFNRRGTRIASCASAAEIACDVPPPSGVETGCWYFSISKPPRSPRGATRSKSHGCSRMVGPRPTSSDQRRRGPTGTKRRRRSTTYPEANC